MFIYLFTPQGIKLVLIFATLLLVFYLQFSKKFFETRYLWLLWLGSAFLVFSFIAIESYEQYKGWRFGGLTRYLLPPYQNISYFFGFVGKQFILPWLVALAVSLLVSSLVSLLNKKFEERFFHKEEIPLFGLGIFLSGYPGFFFYFAAMILISLFWSFYYTIAQKGRAPIYYFWIPTALFVMIIVNFFLPREFLVLFKF